MLKDVPADQWRAFLRVHTIDAASPYLSKPFADEHFAFYDQKLNGQKEQRVRWKRVMDAINENMGMALGELYVADAFPPESKARAKELVSNLQDSLKARIEKLDWMSAETKQKAIEKWAHVPAQDRLSGQMARLVGPQDRSGQLFRKRRRGAKYDFDYQISKVGKPTDRLEWGMTPQTVNAYYNPTDNTINFPAAILQPPFFDAKADDGINYGGIGAVIGHEATHGYDDQGSQFDAKGNNANWWTKDDREKFDARTDRLVKQFDAYEPLPGKHVNGKLTLGENIADLGGLNVAFDALQVDAQEASRRATQSVDGYTPDQRFFLNFARVWRGNILPQRQEVLLNADPHAPAKFRAIAAPSNMPAFAQAFQCKSGDEMVRGGDTQVKIW